MIVRQEDYEKLKSDKKKDRQREIKNKINEECIFVPNGKKNVPIRTPNDFYIDQKKFLVKKEEIINKTLERANLFFSKDVINNYKQNILNNITDNSNSFSINKENKSKRKTNDHQDDHLDRNDNDENGAMDELFKKASKTKINKGFKTIELDNEKNSMSTKITEVLYDKYVGQNIQKSKHLDIYSKIKDEEIRQGREATKTKQDAKKINNMIVRQEDYEKLKSDKKKGRQKEIKNKLHDECFNPNGKKNISSRTPNDFYIDQKRFIDKKEKVINKIHQNILDNEAKNVNGAELISKKF
jgi:hypothetical protein